MSEIAIYADSRGGGVCRSCGAAIEWAELAGSGKRMPFEGAIVAVRSQANILTGRLIEFVDTTITPTHFEKCPEAKQWRRR